MTTLHSVRATDLARNRAVCSILLATCALLAACAGPKAEGAGNVAAATAPEPDATETASTSPMASALDQALNDPQRSQENRERDGARNPKETLLFFGLEPHMTVVEMAPGAGWYTELLAPVLRDEGKLYVTIPALDGPSAKYAQGFLDTVRANPTHYDGVNAVTFELPTAHELGPNDSADLVLTFRSAHGWFNRDQADAVFAAMFAVLKPGGTLGLVQHRAADDADPKVTGPKGYLPESQVIAMAEKTGFVLEERSEINANPNDTRDHPEGVWTLPPALKLGDQDKEKYTAIGESDRMTLRFTKPTSAPTASE